MSLNILFFSPSQHKMSCVSFKRLNFTRPSVRIDRVFKFETRSNDIDTIDGKLSNSVKRIEKLSEYNTSNSRQRTRSYTIWFTICAFCCFLQSYQLCDLYFERLVNSEVIAYRENPLITPSLSFCFSPFQENPKTNETILKDSTCPHVKNSSTCFFANMINMSDVFDTIVLRYRWST